MAISKAIKKEKSNKFEPKLNVPYDVQILGFAEMGTQSVKDFNGGEDDTIEKEQIGVALHFIGFTEDDDDADEGYTYTPCVKKVGKDEFPLIETMVKDANTGKKAFLGKLCDSANAKARSSDGFVDIAACVGKLLTFTRIEDKIGGKDVEIWEVSSMSPKAKKDVETDDTLPKFLFDLVSPDLDSKGNPQAGDGFDDRFDQELPEACGMFLTSKIMQSEEFADLVEGSGCYLDELIEGWVEDYGTFDNPKEKSKKPSRKSPAKKKTTAKKAKNEEVPEEEEEEETPAQKKKRLAAEKKTKAAAKAKEEAEAEADEDDDELSEEELAEIAAAAKAAKAKKAKAKKAAAAKAAAEAAEEEGEKGEEEEEEDPF